MAFANLLVMNFQSIPRLAFRESFDGRRLADTSCGGHVMTPYQCLVLSRSDFGAGGARYGIFLFPKAGSADERIRIVAQPAMRRQFLQFLSISAANNDLVGLEGRHHLLDDLRHVAAPLLLAALL